jgi:hypothetical protein
MHFAVGSEQDVSTGHKIAFKIEKFLVASNEQCGSWIFLELWW